MNAPDGQTPTIKLDPIALQPGDAAAYDSVGRIATESGGGPLLEVPVTGPGGEDLRPRSMLASLRHGLPLVNGFTGLLPAHFLIINVRTARLPEPASLIDLVDLTHLRWLLLRPAGDWKSAEQRERFLQAADGR